MLESLMFFIVLLPNFVQKTEISVQINSQETDFPSHELSVLSMIEVVSFLI